MKIIVCVKRVPDSEARIQLSDGATSIDPTGVKFVLNPYDEFAIEAALKQKEAAGEGSVTVMSLGGPQSAETLRTALAMGADSAVLLKTPDESASGLPVARSLAEELGEREYDLILFGLKAIDDDLQAVSGMVAELLDIPSVSAVTEFVIEDGSVRADREVEGGSEVVELSLPCALSITKGAYKPRYPSLKGIMAAKRKPLEEKEVSLGEGNETTRLTPPQERAAGRIVGEGADAVPELIRLLREEAGVI